LPTSIIRDNHPVKRGHRIHPDRRSLSSELSRYRSCLYNERKPKWVNAVTASVSETDNIPTPRNAGRPSVHAHASCHPSAPIRAVAAPERPCSCPAPKKGSLKRQSAMAHVKRATKDTSSTGSAEWRRAPESWQRATRITRIGLCASVLTLPTAAEVVAGGGACRASRTSGHSQ
jgi:hypothetical protein